MLYRIQILRGRKCVKIQIVGVEVRVDPRFVGSFLRKTYILRSIFGKHSSSGD